MSLYEERMAVLSTAHVTEEESRIIPEMLASGDLIGMQRGEGWLLHTRMSNVSELLPQLTYVLGFAAGQGFVWVLFDRDAEPSEEFEVHDW